MSMTALRGLDLIIHIFLYGGWGRGLGKSREGGVMKIYHKSNRVIVLDARKPLLEHLPLTAERLQWLCQLNLSCQKHTCNCFPSVCEAM